MALRTRITNISALRQHWRYVWPGAILTTLRLCGWTFSLSLLIGCEFNAEFERAAMRPEGRRP